MDEALLKAKGWTRETNIRRDARGNWFENEVLVEHPGVKKAFDSWVAKAPDGRYCLENKIHWVYVELEGPPVFVRHLKVEDSGIQLMLSNGLNETLDAITLRQSSEGILYCDVSNRQLVAQFDSNAMMEMMDVIGSDEQGLFVRVGSEAVRPPVVAEALNHEVDSDGGQ